ncbi:MAG: iron-containing alcohol dehydrogenase family protein [Defluviitaleaceae bacterium]|nr:iron-containing alcohol dehydrogenase family protein [Defluviitaleaceae bacterium]
MRALNPTNKQIEIPYLLKIGNGKTSRVGKYLYDKSFMRIALYMGDGIDDLIGEPFRAGLMEWGVVIIHEQLVTSTDIDDITHSAFSLPSIDAIVGVGGGKALDFAKYSAHLLRVPFISIPTAVSNDGFGSPSCSLTVLGKKKSVKAASPFGIVIDLDVIKNSPDIFMYSGIGDMASKITALKDWQMARDKGLERFVDFASMMAYNSLDILFLKHSLDIHCEYFQRSLASSLMISGLAMEIAGSSRPASGSEHLISHALDEVSAKPKMHGIQVGVATYLCALLQDNPQVDDIKDVFERTGFMDFVRKDPFSYQEFVTALKLAPSIKSNFYSILSEPDSFERALDFIEKDSCLRTVIVPSKAAL